MWAVTLRLCERPDRHYTNEYVEDYGADEYVESNLKSFSTNLWLTIVSTTTVGYGDYYPYTHFGRIVIILSCIVGNMYIGILIVEVTK